MKWAAFLIILCLAGLPIRADSSEWNHLPDNGLYSIIARAAKRYRIEIELIKAMIMAESGYDAKAVSNRGACGLMQLMPETAENLGVTDCFDPEENIDAGVRYFHKLKTLFNKNITLALAAYNAGPTRVKKYGRIPKFSATRRYIEKVLKFYLIYKQGGKPD